MPENMTRDDALALRDAAYATGVVDERMGRAAIPDDRDPGYNTTTDLPPADAVVEVAFRGRVAAYNDDYNGTVSVEVLADDGRSLGYYANVPREAVWIADEHAGGA